MRNRYVVILLALSTGLLLVSVAGWVQSCLVNWTFRWVAGSGVTRTTVSVRSEDGGVLSLHIARVTHDVTLSPQARWSDSLAQGGWTWTASPPRRFEGLFEFYWDHGSASSGPGELTRFMRIRLSYSILVMVSAVYPLWWLAGIRRRRIAERLRQNHCPLCDYYFAAEVM
jgi:hypothetical protein